MVFTFMVGLVISRNSFYRVTVSGKSMDYTLYDGQSLWVNNLPWVSYNRGSIAIIDESGTQVVKRVLAIPGDTLKFDDDKLLVNRVLVKEPYVTDTAYDKGLAEKEITLGNDEYFVLGDNRDNSNDSRFFGEVSRSQLRGVVVGYE